MTIEYTPPGYIAPISLCACGCGIDIYAGDPVTELRSGAFVLTGHEEDEEYDD